MKVLLITPSYFPIIGGSESLTRILATKLNEIGIKADIMTFNMNKKWNPMWKAETIRDGVITVFKIPAFNPLPNLPNPLSNLFQIYVMPNLSFIKRLRHYDVIHFIGEADLSFPLLSYCIKRPKILHCVGIFEHGGIYKYYMFDRPFLRNIFLKCFTKMANAYIAYSTLEKKLLSNLGITKEKILILPLGVDTEIFQPNETEKSDNLILFVGRIDRIKGVHILLNALRYIEIPLQLAIIGPGWDEKYVKEIEQMSHEINEKSIHRVRLLGAMGHSDLVSWYQKASVLVSPYLYETFSTVTLEALACGTPVVSTGTQITNQGSDGILVTPKDPQKLADAIRKMLEDRELRVKYGRAGRKLIEQHFSWETIIKRLTEIYTDLLAN